MDKIPRRGAFLKVNMKDVGKKIRGRRRQIGKRRAKGSEHRRRETSMLIEGMMGETKA